MKKNTSTKKNKKKQRKIYKLTIFCIFLDIFVVTCFFLAYGPYDKLRNLYITTAMKTMNHQYLAKIFYSDKTIKKVMNSNYLIKINDKVNLDNIVINTKDTGHNPAFPLPFSPLCPQNCEAPESFPRTGDCCPFWLSETPSSRSSHRYVCRRRSRSTARLPGYRWRSLPESRGYICPKCSFQNARPDIFRSFPRYLGCCTYGWGTPADNRGR